MRQINWMKTKNNILGRVLQYGKKSDYIDFFGLASNTVYEKLKNNSPLNIEEVVAFSEYLGLVIEDLLVFEDDDYIPFDLENVVDNYEGSAKDRECEIASRKARMEEELANLEIRNLREFLIYLPLINPKDLNNALQAIFGDVTERNISYIRHRLNQLYNSIPESKAKDYADEVRTEMRIKGNASLSDAEDFDVIFENHSEYMFRIHPPFHARGYEPNMYKLKDDLLQHEEEYFMLVTEFFKNKK